MEVTQHSIRPEATAPSRIENTPIEISGRHFVTGAAITPPFPEGLETVLFGMGCFWGAEREFWLTDGVVATAVGYAGGTTRNPSYEDVCSGRTGHTEAVLVVYDPTVVSFGALLKRFWEAHDPTQGMRQGPDRGSQYRSAIYTTTPAQQAEALASRDRYGADLAAAGFGEITTEIQPATDFFYAEEYHQQYLARNLARGGIDPKDVLLRCGCTAGPSDRSRGVLRDAADRRVVPDRAPGGRAGHKGHYVESARCPCRIGCCAGAASGDDAVHCLGATGEAAHEAGTDGGDGNNQGNPDECDKKRILDHARAAAVHEI